MALDYKSTGRLLASCPVIGANRDLILVDLTAAGSPHYKFVVSKYQERSTEWDNGHYFNTYNEAFAYFTSELFMMLPIDSIDTHPKLGMAVKKLDGFLDKIAKAK